MYENRLVIRVHGAYETRVWLGKKTLRLRVVGYSVTRLRLENANAFCRNRKILAPAPLRYRGKSNL